MGDKLALGLVVGCAIGFIFAGFVGFFSRRILWHWGRARDIGERIAIAESKAEAEPEKAKPAWDLARMTLEAYFNQNLSQINYIFLLSALVMIVGFGIIIWGISQAIQCQALLYPPQSLAQQVSTAVASPVTTTIGPILPRTWGTFPRARPH